MVEKQRSNKSSKAASVNHVLIESDHSVVCVLSAVAKAFSELSQLEVGAGQLAFVFYEI